MAARKALVECYSDLEKANTNYIVAAEIDIEENQEDASYLYQPHQDLIDALFTYGEFMEREEEPKKVSEAQERQLKLNMQKAEKFKGDLAILEARIASFGSPAENVSKLITEGILFVNMRTDMRTEIKRMEDRMHRLI